MHFLKLAQKQLPLIVVLTLLLQCQWDVSSWITAGFLFFVWVLLKSLLCVYALSVSFDHLYCATRRSPRSLMQSTKAVLGRFHHILAACAVFLILPLVLWGLAVLAVQGSTDRFLGLFVFMLAGVALIYYSTRYVFVIPAILVRNENAIQAYGSSWQMTEWHWFRCFSFYAILMLVHYALDPQTRHTHYLIAHHAQAAFTLLLVAVVLPLFTQLWVRLFSEYEAEL